MKLRVFPDPILTEVSEPVTDFDEAIECGIFLQPLEVFCDEMYDVMIASNGVGLSAVQVGVLKRIIIMELPGEERYDIINPEIIDRSRGLFQYSEGCLSVPGFFDNRVRNVGITLRYQTVNGNTVEKDFEEIAAFCIQHEMDHLEGKLFIDDLSPLKKERIRKKIDKTLRRQ